MSDEASSRTDWRERVDFRRRTSVATRLAVGILVVSIVTIITTVVISSASVSTSSNELLNTRVDTRASTLEAELEAYFANLSDGIEFLAASPAFGQLVVEYRDAYRELGGTPIDDLDTQQNAVATFYADVYLENLSTVRGVRVDPAEFIPTGDSAATILQSLYLAGNPFEGLERRLLTDGGDGSTWTEIHNRTHRTLRELSERLGFLDLIVVDAATEAIIYAVNKDVSFATSLASGPHSGTSLAGLVRSVLDEPAEGVVRAADVSVFPPVLDNPTAFLAAPVIQDGIVVGVVVGSLPFTEVNRIMTQDWRDGRFGETGETYLVGPDRTMRSDARLLVEDPSADLGRVDELGSVTGVDRNRMQALDTSIIFQPVEGEAVQRGLSGEEGTLRAKNYLGVDVLSSVRVVDGALFDWILLVEQEVAEAEEPVTSYIRSTLVITVVLIVVLTFVAVAWSSGFMAPIRAMSAALRDIRDGSDTTEIPSDGAAEFRTLAHHLGSMVDALRERQDAVLDALRSKAAVVRTLMPDVAATKVDLGERHLLDAVPQATVAVVLVDGLDELVSSAGAEQTRSHLHELVDRLDTLAGAQGLDRVKVTGDAYFAVCGLGDPLVDHAPRSATFARQAIEAIMDMAAEEGIDLAARAGLASGSLATGLVGTTGLLFDIWGEPVDDAFALAHAADTGSVLAARSTHERIPSTTEMAEVTTPTGIAWVIEPQRRPGRGDAP